MSGVLNETSSRRVSPPMTEVRTGSKPPALSPLTLRHRIETDFASLSGMQPAWDALVEDVGGDIYSTYDWCAVWWRHYGSNRRLEVHLFHEGDQLVAILPLFRERLWIGLFPLHVVRLVGCDHSVTTCAPIVRPEFISQVMPALVESLHQSGRWDLLHLGLLAGYFAHREAIGEALRGCSGVGEVHSSDRDGPHIVFDLPESYEKYLAGLSSHERHNVRKREKRLAKEHQRRDVLISVQDVPAEMEEFVREHQAQWRQTGHLGHFEDWPGAEPYHREMALTQAKRGRLTLLRLDADAVRIGYQYNYRFGNRLHWLLGSRTLEKRWEDYSPGRLLFCATVLAAIGMGVRHIDGLRGMYDYKLRLGGAVRQLQSVSAIQSGTMNRIRVASARRFAVLLDLLYYRIWFGRLAPMLPFPRRGLWRTWIRSRL